MGNRNCRWSWKFYEEQVAEIERLLVADTQNSSSKLDFETYLKICEQTGETPDPRRMPQETLYPEEVQVAFFIFGQLKDSFDGMSGTYLGKEWSSCEFFLNLHEIEDKKTVVFWNLLSWSLLGMMQDGEN